MENNDVSSVDELIEAARDALPQVKIVNVRKQLAKQLARHVLYLEEKPEGDLTPEDLLATIDIVVESFSAGHFFTEAMAYRAVKWADALPFELKVFCFVRLGPLVSGSPKDVITNFKAEFEDFFV